MCHARRRKERGGGVMKRRRDTEQHGKDKHMKERVNGKEVMNIHNITSCTHAHTHAHTHLTRSSQGKMQHEW